MPGSPGCSGAQCVEGSHPGGRASRDQATQQRNADPQANGKQKVGQCKGSIAKGRMEKDVHYLAEQGRHELGKRITGQQAQSRPHQAQEQAFDHHQAHHGAAGGANRAQHANVPLSFDDDGAKGVEQDKTSHSQGQHPEQGQDQIDHAHHRLPGLSPTPQAAGLVSWAQGS